MVGPMSGVNEALPLVRVLVIGTGSVGMRHLEVLNPIIGEQVIALPKRPSQIKHLHDLGYKTCNNPDEAVQMGVTHCIVATETGSHLKDSLCALDRGFHLLVEKPLACDANEALEILSKARCLGLNVNVGCVLRFSESLNIFRSRLREVGELHSVRIECQSYLPSWGTGRPYIETFRSRPRQGGVMLDLIHEIDYAGWIFGWPNSVQSRMKNLGVLGIDADEADDLWWETKQGCSVSIRLDFITKPDRRSVVACGRRGTISWDGVLGNVSMNLPGFKSQNTSTKQQRNDMFADQARAFLNLDRNERDTRLATGEEGLKALHICDAARNSSELNKEVKVVY